MKVNPYLPMMLGNVSGNDFTSQSMVQVVEMARVICMTLHPMSDDNVKVPTHL